MKYFSLSLVICFLSVSASAQFSTGTWRDHLPYGNTIDVCTTNEGYVYCATPYGMFFFNPYDNDVQRISKINRLSDVGLSAIEFDKTNNAVIVGYVNGNLDILFPGSEVNLPDIKLSSLLGDKRIYDILPYDGKVYLSTGIGIVVIDMERLEVKSTYIIGQNGDQIGVNDVAIHDNKIYAATDQGIKFADLSNNFLSNFQNWSDLSGLPSSSPVKDIEFFVDQMFINMEGESQDIVYKRSSEGGSWEIFVQYDGFRINNIWSNEGWLGVAGNGAYQLYHFDLFLNINETQHGSVVVNCNNVVMDELGAAWAADANGGLLWRKGSGEKVVIRPGGPAQAAARRIDAYNNNVWMAHGGINDSGGNTWNKSPMSGFVDEEWKIIYPGSGLNGVDGVNDFMDVAVNPKNNSRVTFASWEEGLVEKQSDGSVRIYSPETGDNTLEEAGYDWAPGWTGVAGVTYDLNGVLWCTNSYCADNIHARTADGQFYAFDFAPSLSESDRVTDILATQFDYIWAIVAGKGLIVLSTNGTVSTQSDDNYKLLNDEEGNGGLPNKDVYCIREDLDGEVWVGTLQGIAVFYNQDAIFTEENFDCEQILIQQDGNYQYLLETEAVTSIEVDGGNRKWVGTQNSGVFLFSSDGLTEIYHFTKENSPLLSNNVYDIAINQENGEVFFGTENGVVSFFSTATNYDQEMSNVIAYPNPVREDFSGNITIDGLAYDTNVKITDIQGNVVFETQSQGGRAVWNGKMYSGERPSTGIYLVFAATSDGQVDNVGKITFIR